MADTAPRDQQIRELIEHHPDDEMFGVRRDDLTQILAELSALRVRQQALEQGIQQIADRWIGLAHGNTLTDVVMCVCAKRLISLLSRPRPRTDTGETMMYNILSRHIHEAGQEPVLLRFPNDHPFIETRTLDGALAGCYLCGGEPEIHRTWLLPLPDRCLRHDVILDEAHECALCAAEDLAQDARNEAD